MFESLAFECEWQKLRAELLKMCLSCFCGAQQSNEGKGAQAALLCLLGEMFIPFPLITHTKSAHSSLCGREGFCPKQIHH